MHSGHTIGKTRVSRVHIGVRCRLLGWFPEGAAGFSRMTGILRLAHGPELPQVNEGGVGRRHILAQCTRWPALLLLPHQTNSRPRTRALGRLPTPLVVKCVLKTHAIPLKCVLSRHCSSNSHYRPGMTLGSDYFWVSPMVSAMRPTIMGPMNIPKAYMAWKKPMAVPRFSPATPLMLRLIRSGRTKPGPRPPMPCET